MHFVEKEPSQKRLDFVEKLKSNNASVEFWKTGHSYIKQKTFELNALAESFLVIEQVKNNQRIK